MSDQREQRTRLPQYLLGVSPYFKFDFSSAQNPQYSRSLPYYLMKSVQALSNASEVDEELRNATISSLNDELAALKFAAQSKNSLVRLS